MKRSLKELVRANILALEPYSTARDEYSGGEIDVWLDANENPFENGVNRYPDPHQREMKALLSEIKGVSSESIFVGNGSDEAIDLAFRVFCRPGVDNAISIAPTYGMYSVAAATNDVELREVALGEEFSLPVEALLAAADECSKLMWICSPNNPTGAAFAAEQLVELIERFDGIVVLDEAYVDFSADGGMLPRLGEFENLIILQTLSKAWGMAGLRCGLGFSSAEIIAIMNRVKSPYNINVLTQAKVMELLRAGVSDQVEEIISQRERVSKALESMACVEKIYPSDANFLLVRVSDADRLYDRLTEGGVIVRNRSKVLGCKSTLRITIGTKSENDRTLEIIKEFK
ncbi:MAG: histidinol-phosphate transaminase [Rikenellaceae bacterium]